MTSGLSLTDVALVIPAFRWILAFAIGSLNQRKYGHCKLLVQRSQDFIIMKADPTNPEALLRVPNEIEAAVIVSALAEYGIESYAIGRYASALGADSGFSSVDVTVRHADIESAKQALAKIKENQWEIDWNTVDVGEGDVGESDS